MACGVRAILVLILLSQGLFFAASQQEKVNASAHLENATLYNDSSFDALLFIEKISGPDEFNATIEICISPRTNSSHFSYSPNPLASPALDADFNFKSESVSATPSGFGTCFPVEVFSKSWKNGQKAVFSISGKFVPGDNFLSAIDDHVGSDALFSNYLLCPETSFEILPSRGIRFVSETQGSFSLGHRGDLPRKKAVIVSQGKRICYLLGSKECRYRTIAHSFAKTLYFEGYEVEFFDLNYTVWGNSSSRSVPEASAFFHELVWSNISEEDLAEGTYILLLGDIDILSPCEYSDPLYSGKAYSDYCYSTRSGKAERPEAVVSRFIALDDLQGTELAYAQQDHFDKYYSPSHRVYQNFGDSRFRKSERVPCFGKSECFFALRMKEVSRNNVFGDFEGAEHVPPLEGFSFLSALGGKEFFSACKNISVLDGKLKYVHSPVEFYFLHSTPSNAEWFDSQGNVAVSGNVNVYANPIVFSSACYGAVAYCGRSNNTIARDTLKAAMMPGVFVGSQSVSDYGGNNGFPVGSDLLSRFFYENLRKGESAGDALLHAKQRLYDYEYKSESFQNELTGFFDYLFFDDRVEKINKRTVFIFDMYGDPTLSAEQACGDSYVEK